MDERATSAMLARQFSAAMAKRARVRDFAWGAAAAAAWSLYWATRGGGPRLSYILLGISSSALVALYALHSQLTTEARAIRLTLRVRGEDLVRGTRDPTVFTAQEICADNEVDRQATDDVLPLG
jgi:hypothetical protein